MYSHALHTCDPDNMQQGGMVGEEAHGAERHPGERGDLPQRAGHPVDGNINPHRHKYKFAFLSSYV